MPDKSTERYVPTKKFEGKKRPANRYKSPRSSSGEANIVFRTVLAAMVVALGPGIILDIIDQNEPSLHKNTVLRNEPKGASGGEELIDVGTVNNPTFNLIYGSLDEDQMRQAIQAHEIEKSIVRNDYLDSETFERVKRLEPLIWQASQKYNVPSDLLLGMVIVESRGEVLAVSGAGAKGATQMMDEVAESYDLAVSGADTQSAYFEAQSDYVNRETGELDNRFYPEKIIPATAFELGASYERWGDWSLAVWEWHAGAPEIYDNLRDYIFGHFGENLDEMRGLDVQPAMELVQIYRDRISKYKLNTAKLLADPLILAKYEGRVEFDLTEVYAKRVVAAAEVFNDMKAENSY